VCSVFTAVRRVGMEAELAAVECEELGRIGFCCASRGEVVEDPPHLGGALGSFEDSSPNGVGREAFRGTEVGRSRQQEMDWGFGRQSCEVRKNVCPQWCGDVVRSEDLL